MSFSACRTFRFKFYAVATGHFVPRSPDPCSFLSIDIAIAYYDQLLPVAGISSRRLKTICKQPRDRAISAQSKPLVLRVGSREEDAVWISSDFRVRTSH